MTRISAPTPYVWIIGRTKTDGPPDYGVVHKIQAGYKVTPLSEWGKAAQPVLGKVDPSVDMKTPAKIQVDTMPADKFFAYAAEILKVNPPHITDQPMTAQLKKIGIEAGKTFDMSKADPTIRSALATAPQDAQQLMSWKLATLARVVNGWSMNTETMGVYGNYYSIPVGYTPKRGARSLDSLNRRLHSDKEFRLELFSSSDFDLN